MQLKAEIELHKRPSPHLCLTASGDQPTKFHLLFFVLLSVWLVGDEQLCFGLDISPYDLQPGAAVTASFLLQSPEYINSAFLTNGSKRCQGC